MQDIRPEILAAAAALHCYVPMATCQVLYAEFAINRCNKLATMATSLRTLVKRRPHVKD